MRTMTRRTSILVLAVFGFSLAARGADDPKKIEATPQAKAYRALLKTVETGDVDGYKKCMVSAAAKDMDKQAKEMGKTNKDMMGFLKMMAPTDVKLTSLKVDGKKATLTATGKMDGEMNKGTINLEQEGDQWKVGQQSWTNAK
jgi:hypothetical protein